MKRSKFLLLSGIMGTLYLIYLITCFTSGFISSEDAVEVISTGVAATLVMPHAVCIGGYSNS